MMYHELSTRQAFIEDADADIRMWLKDNPHGTYMITAGLVEVMQEWGGNLSIYNSIGLKRRLGKILKEMGYIKRLNSSPPIWEKPGWVAPIVEPELPKGIVARISGFIGGLF